MPATGRKAPTGRFKFAQFQRRDDPQPGERIIKAEDRQLSGGFDERMPHLAKVADPFQPQKLHQLGRGQLARLGARQHDPAVAHHFGGYPVNQTLGTPPPPQHKVKALVGKCHEEDHQHGMDERHFGVEHPIPDRRTQGNHQHEFDQRHLRDAAAANQTQERDRPDPDHRHPQADFQKEQRRVLPQQHALQIEWHDVFHDPGPRLSDRPTRRRGHGSQGPVAAPKAALEPIALWPVDSADVPHLGAKQWRREMNVMKTLGPIALASVLATSAFGAVDRISSIDVTADLTAISNEKAAAYWGNLETDLEAAIAARVTDRLADDGAEIKIDIREIELANALERGLDLADAVLVGMVHVVDDTDNSNYNSYELSVSLGSTALVFPEGETVVVNIADTPDAYSRLIEVFADGVVKRLD